MELELDTTKLQDRLERMEWTIEETALTHMPAEFAVWQEDDVNRRRAVVNQDGYSVSCIFWSRKKRRRPEILRPFLFDKLTVRMRELLAREIKW